MSGHLLVEHVSKKYGKTQVLSDLSFSIDSSEQLVIKGASGSGKSTLLYLLGGLDTADSGSIKVAGQNLSQLDDESLARYRNKSVGFVFQFHFLLSSMNCLDNILLPARIAASRLKDVKANVMELADILKVSHCLNKYPHEISGGEQQRVNIIRALSLKPKLLLCDEPTGNLDSQNSVLVMKLLRDLAAQYGSTLIIVTHDEKIANSFERKITIEDGRIIS